MRTYFLNGQFLFAFVLPGSFDCTWGTASHMFWQLWSEREYACITFSFCLLQENKHMKKRLHTSRPSLKQRTKVRQKRSIVIKPVPQIQIISSLCLMRSQMLLLQITCGAADCTEGRVILFVWLLLTVACKIRNHSIVCAFYLSTPTLTFDLRHHNETFVSSNMVLWPKLTAKKKKANRA